jgi:hypothetical protein
MIKIIEGNIVICNTCGHHLSYDKEDTFPKYINYETYGEINYQEVRCIMCPICNSEVYVRIEE